MDPLEILAHAGHGHGPPALAAIAVAAMVIPLVVLGFVGRAFWRAAQRDSEESAATPPPAGARRP